jgi:predicted secreted protein
MAAPQTQKTGLTYLLYYGDPDSGTTPNGYALAGGTNASISQTHDLTEVTNKDNAAWQSWICGAKSWSMTCDGAYLAGGSEVCGDEISFYVGSSSGSGGTLLKGIKNISLEASAEMIASANVTTGTVREVYPSKRGVSITITGDWYDPGFDTAQASLENYVNGTSTGNVECTFGFAGTTTTPTDYLYANFRVTDFEVTAPVDEFMQYTITLQSDGSVTAPTETLGATDGVATVLAAMFNASAVQSFNAYLSSDVADEWEYSGTVYPERFSIDAPYEGGITYSFSLAGSGALTSAAGDA